MCRSKPFKFVASVAALGFALVAAAGCSNSPVGPQAPVTDEPVVLTRMSRGSSATGASEVNLYQEQVISAETGGRLELLDVVLDVPPGAVPSDTLFSIFIPDDDLFYNEFGTHGLVFDVPVTVTMSYRDADLSSVDETTIRIAWHNGDGVWEDVECTLDLDNRLVTAQLSHFSAYGLISDVKSGGQ
jgi:hypothetical protein